MKVIVTNNPKVFENIKNKKIKILYLEAGKYLDVLKKVRDEVHLGAKILTHPLTSSLKPNETPYKSIIIDEGEKIDFESIEIISNSIEVAEKFLKVENKNIYTKRVLEDFQTIDMSTLMSGLESMEG